MPLDRAPGPGASAPPVRVLQLEDSPEDAEIELVQLRHAGIAPVAHRVDSREAFLGALDSFKPDVVLADYKLPAFDGKSALAIVRATHPEIPVVMVSGVLGDEEAVELVKAGAHDFVLKDRMARLGAAVQRALGDARAARGLREAQEALRASEEKFRAIFDNVRDGILVMNPVEHAVWLANPVMESMLGYGPGEMVGLTLGQIHPASALSQVMRQFDLGATGDLRFVQDIPMLRKDGQTLFMNLAGSPVQIGGRRLLLGAFRDATERRASEEKLRVQLEELQRWQSLNLGREDRVLALKREVNELTRQLNQPLRYPSAQ